MINFYIGLGTGLLIAYLFYVLSKRIANNAIANKAIVKHILNNKEDSSLEVETAINNIMNYNEDVALHDIKKRRG